MSGMTLPGAAEAQRLCQCADLLRPAGDRAVLLTPSDPAHVPRLLAALRENPIAGVVDWAGAAETVLVVWESAVFTEKIRRELEILAARIQLSAAEEPSAERSMTPECLGEPVVIPVHYDGPDLVFVADHLGLEPDEVIAAHTRRIWECAFVGFAPGFGYLTSEKAESVALVVPRRRQPRTAIPAGSVALAGGYSAVYPAATPGGWQLIGRTQRRVWDVTADPPALIRAGTRVRFRQVGVG